MNLFFFFFFFASMLWFSVPRGQHWQSAACPSVSRQCTVVYIFLLQNLERGVCFASVGGGLKQPTSCVRRPGQVCMSGPNHFPDDSQASNICCIYDFFFLLERLWFHWGGSNETSALFCAFDCLKCAYL